MLAPNFPPRFVWFAAKSGGSGAGSGSGSGSGGAAVGGGLGGSEDEWNELRQRVALYMEELDILRVTDHELKDELSATKQQLQEVSAQRQALAAQHQTLAAAHAQAENKVQQFGMSKCLVLRCNQS
jgi:chromosome segregation ATPase